MAGQRKRYSAQLKTKVALEAINPRDVQRAKLKYRDEHRITIDLASK